MLVVPKKIVLSSIHNKGPEMKYFIIFLVIISLPLYAQRKKSNSKIDVKIQMTEWMAKISSDPELREAMIEMILDNTKGNINEMTKFGKTIMDNAEMNSIITNILLQKIIVDNISVKPQAIFGDSSSTMKLTINKVK